MPTNQQIIERFFEAIRHYMQVNNIRFFSNFCDEFNLPRPTLLRIEKETHRQFHPEWLSLMVSLGYSAHWLLTGNGKMTEKKRLELHKNCTLSNNLTTSLKP